MLHRRVCLGGPNASQEDRMDLSLPPSPFCFDDVEVVKQRDPDRIHNSEPREAVEPDQANELPKGPAE